MNEFKTIFKNSLVGFVFVIFVFIAIVQGPKIDSQEEEKNQTISNIMNNELKNEGNALFIPDKKIIINVTDVELEIGTGDEVKAWAFNNTVPGPPLRFTEDDKVTIEFRNNSTYPHTLHFHGIHNDKNDGVLPVIMPGQSYLYNITAEPAGTLMYHCHTMPVSEHIRMGCTV
jgi:nitrite reductase (NO-forming)